MDKSYHAHVCLRTDMLPYATLTPGTNMQLTRIRRQYCDTAYLLGIVTEICFEHMNRINIYTVYIFFSVMV